MRLAFYTQEQGQNGARLPAEAETDASGHRNPSPPQSADSSFGSDRAALSLCDDSIVSLGKSL